VPDPTPALRAHRSCRNCITATWCGTIDRCLAEHTPEEREIVERFRAALPSVGEAVACLAWRTERPDAAGWWWARWPNPSPIDATCPHAYYVEPVTVGGVTHGLYIRGHNCTITDAGRYPGWEWAGPIPLPGDAPSAAGRGGDGVALIAAERRRQVEAEGWTAKHDDEHTGGEIAKAAACYALPKKRTMRRVHYQPPRDPAYSVRVPVAWPWDAEWWKPTPEDRARELVKAGALIAAEIDRLQRATLLAAEARGRGEAAGG